MRWTKEHVKEEVARTHYILKRHTLHCINKLIHNYPSNVLEIKEYNAKSLVSNIFRQTINKFYDCQSVSLHIPARDTMEVFIIETVWYSLFFSFLKMELFEKTVTRKKWIKKLYFGKVQFETALPNGHYIYFQFFWSGLVPRDLGDSN